MSIACINFLLNHTKGIITLNSKHAKCHEQVHSVLLHMLQSSVSNQIIMIELVSIACLDQTHIIYLMDVCYATALMRHTGISVCEWIMAKINFWLAATAWCTRVNRLAKNCFLFAKIITLNISYRFVFLGDSRSLCACVFSVRYWAFL